MPPPSEQQQEDELKIRLKNSKEWVTEFQMFVTALNDTMKPTVGLLQSHLSTIAVCSSFIRNKGLALNANLSPNSTLAKINSRLKVLIDHCIYLQEHADSIVDATKIDSIIAEVEFEIFTPPHGITVWADWASHQRQTHLKDLKSLEEAVDWWEKMRQHWENIKAMVLEVRAALYSDINRIQGISMGFENLHVTGSVCV
jgi:hypothetical protein